MGAVKLGCLYVIPSTLCSPTDVCHDSLNAVLPREVQAVVARCAVFVVETPKVARQFLKAVGTDVPLQSLQLAQLDVKTSDAAVRDLLAPLLAGQDVGLLSDAGCPAVADPGARLVAAAHAAGVRVVPLVGPSSILLGLMGSGLNGQRFAFQGYLPIEGAARVRELKRLEQESASLGQTQLFIETPYRNMALFEALLKHLQPSTRLCVAVDLTLASECVRTLSVREWQVAVKRGEGLALDKRPTLFLFLAA